jgi:hypothetical protein
MPENAARIPASYVERFRAAYAAFVDEVRRAIDDAAAQPDPGAAEGLSMWRYRALPALQQRLAQIQSAVARYHIGDETPIVQSADDASGLAKNLDPFPMDFAGPDHKQALESLLRQVVLLAYPVCRAAGLS